MRPHGFTLQLVLSAAFASAQNAFSREGLLCNKTFAEANATGFFTVNPNVDQGSQSGQPDNDSGKTLPVDIAFTLTQTNNGTETDLTWWVNPRGANYSNNFALGYDVCAMALGPLTNEATYQGQKDNGSCYDTFDDQCISALKQQASQYALSLTQYPTPLPDSNLTVNSISTVCDDIRDSINNNFPAECLTYFNSSPTAFASTALTGYNSSTLYSSNCSTNASHNDAYYLAYSGFDDYNSTNYATDAHTITPLLAIWLPIANAERPSTILYATSELICSHVEDYNPGSEVPAALADPDSSGKGGLSKGAIAGIVVGVVVGLLLIGAAVGWWLMKKRKAKRVIAAESPPEPKEEENKYHYAAEAPALTTVSEMPTNDRKYELEGGANPQVHELPHVTYELDGRSNVN